MKMLFDIIPIICFFVAYKLFNIIIATGVAIAASLVQLIVSRYQHGSYQRVHLISFGSLFVLGSATILLKNELFIKWKPTAIYWILATVFFISQFFGNKPLLQRMSGDALKLSDKLWRQLNISWGIFFAIMGLANLYIIYNFDTNSWVNFKLFGTLGLTAVFVIGQAIYLANKTKV